MDDRQERAQERALKAVAADPGLGTTALLERLVDKIEELGDPLINPPGADQSYYESARSRALEVLGVADRGASAPELITDLTNHIRAMREVRDELEEQRNALHHEREQAEKLAVDLHQRLEQQRNAITALVSTWALQLADRDTALANSMAEGNAMQPDDDGGRDYFAEDRADVKIKVLREDAEQSAQRAEAAERRVALLTKDVKAYRETYETMRQQTEELRSELRSYIESHANMQQHIEALERQLEEAAEIAHKWRQEAQDLDGRLREANDNYQRQLWKIEELERPTDRAAELMSEATKAHTRKPAEEGPGDRGAMPPDEAAATEALQRPQGSQGDTEPPTDARAQEKFAQAVEDDTRRIRERADELDALARSIDVPATHDEIKRAQVPPIEELLSTDLSEHHQSTNEMWEKIYAETAEARARTEAERLEKEHRERGQRYTWERREGGPGPTDLEGMATREPDEVVEGKTYKVYRIDPEEEPRHELKEHEKRGLTIWAIDIAAQIASGGRLMFQINEPKIDTAVNGVPCLSVEGSVKLVRLILEAVERGEYARYGIHPPVPMAYPETPPPQAIEERLRDIVGTAYPHGYQEDLVLNLAAYIEGLFD